eukprot:gene1779-16266_t
MPDNDIGDWFRGIPLITRWWFILSIAFPLAGRIGLLNPMYMFLSWELVAYKFQFLMDALILSVLYVWCQINKDTIVQFWFGTQFKAVYGTLRDSVGLCGTLWDSVGLCGTLWDSVGLCGTLWDSAMYLPWVLAAFNMILGQGGVMEIIGIFVGHLYFFLAFKYPQDFGGMQFIKTPEILYSYLPNRRGGVAGFGQAPASRRQDNGNRQGGQQWGGGGRRLGDD